MARFYDTLKIEYGKCPRSARSAKKHALKRKMEVGRASPELRQFVHRRSDFLEL